MVVSQVLQVAPPQTQAEPEEVPPQATRPGSARGRTGPAAALATMSPAEDDDTTVTSLVSSRGTSQAAPGSEGVLDLDREPRGTTPVTRRTRLVLRPRLIA